jgi:NADH:ubiquinone oxidoreductase subunit 3 (subunit A)
MCLDEITTAGIVSMYIFLIVLTVGFYYEWKKGDLDWS